MSSNENSNTRNTTTSSIDTKIIAAETTGVPAEFTSEEAERMGCFTEDALSEAEALESSKEKE